MNVYRDELSKAIAATHGAKAVWLESVPVTEVFRGETAWEGVVEVFTLSDHPKTKRCYAWGYKDGKEWAITSVLEIPPVLSPETAVKVAIAARARKAIPRL